MSDSVRPQRQQPTRLPRPWDSLGKTTGVDCHFLLQCMKVKSESEVAQSCPTLHNPMDCSSPGSSVHEIFQAMILEWVERVLTEKSVFLYHPTRLQVVSVYLNKQKSKQKRIRRIPTRDFQFSTSLDLLCGQS